jgi:serine protease Do
MSVLPQLKDRGRVSRGYIGVDLTDESADLRKSLRFGPAHGALVEDVAADTPADHAGLRVYDLITAVDDRPIRSDDDLIRYISARTPGSVSRLTVWRDGTARDIPIRLTERPLPRSAHSDAGESRTVRPAVNQDQAPLGLGVKDLDAATIRRLNLPEAMVGVLITDVDPAGPARLARIRPGQVLLEINRRRVTSASEYRAVVASLKPSDSVAVFAYDRLTDRRAIYAVILDSQ